MRFIGSRSSALVVTSLRLFSHFGRLQSPQSLVICGPSGVGKGTIISNILSLYPQCAELCVSHTSRSPRPGEVDGVHYYFTTREQMEIDTAQGENKFIEFANVHGNIYGTSYSAVQKIHERNKLCVVDVDTRGVKQLKVKEFPAKFIFIAPPSVEDLQTRLRGRGTESAAQLELRLANARAELVYGTKDNFDEVVTNDVLARSVESISKLMKLWFPSLIK